MVSHSEKSREVVWKALHKKAKGMWIIGPIEQKLTSKESQGSMCAGERGGGIWDCPSPAIEGGSEGFQGSGSVLVFSCKSSLPFKGQKKTFNRSSVAGTTVFPHFHPSVCFKIKF